MLGVRLALLEQLIVLLVLTCCCAVPLPVLQGVATTLQLGRPVCSASSKQQYLVQRRIHQMCW
jgi:hypothetical protein